MDATYFLSNESQMPKVDIDGTPMALQFWSMIWKTATANELGTYRIFVIGFLGESLTPQAFVIDPNLGVCEELFGAIIDPFEMLLPQKRDPRMEKLFLGFDVGKESGDGSEC